MPFFFLTSAYTLLYGYFSSIMDVDCYIDLMILGK